VNATECRREQDVLDAMAAGRWPDRCDAELSAHVASCAICGDVVAVARAFRDEHEAAWRNARVPPSGRVWWRAEMRARQEAARKAAQPITFVQGIAGACAAGIVAALISFVWPAVWESLGIVAALRSGKDAFNAGLLQLAALSTSLPPQILLSLAIALAAALVLTPLALYFVFSEK
jgi:predicted anti-sigma-YlaC factor YlaD